MHRERSPRQRKYGLVDITQIDLEKAPEKTADVIHVPHWPRQHISTAADPRLHHVP
jgi:hypothetical protein